jgi:hypothetical protein
MYMSKKYYDALDNILDRPIAFNPSFKKITGSTNAALLLSQAFYWSKRTADKDGWFYKTREDWMDETGLTLEELDGARAKCKASGVMEEKLKGVPATVHYRVNKPKVYELLGVQIGGIPQSSFSDLPQIGGKPESGSYPIFNKESETTTEITTENGAGAPLPLDWQIAAGAKTIHPLSEENVFLGKVRDAASLIDFQCPGAGVLAEAFMIARRLVIPSAKVKGNRKAAREMLDLGVQAQHVTQATEFLMKKNLTVVDLFSVSKTAIDLANRNGSKPLPVQESPDDLAAARAEADRLFGVQS